MAEQAPPSENSAITPEEKLLDEARTQAAASKTDTDVALIYAAQNPPLSGMYTSMALSKEKAARDKVGSVAVRRKLQLQPQEATDLTLREALSRAVEDTDVGLKATLCVPSGFFGMSTTCIPVDKAESQLAAQLLEAPDARPANVQLATSVPAATLRPFRSAASNQQPGILTVTVDNPAEIQERLKEMKLAEAPSVSPIDTVPVLFRIQPDGTLETQLTQQQLQRKDLTFKK